MDTPPQLRASRTICLDPRFLVICDAQHTRLFLRYVWRRTYDALDAPRLPARISGRSQALQDLHDRESQESNWGFYASQWEEGRVYLREL
jgi:hypothetical protein